jgi:hypothetical protein
MIDRIMIPNSMANVQRIQPQQNSSQWKNRYKLFIE